MFVARFVVQAVGALEECVIAEVVRIALDRSLASAALDPHAVGTLEELDTSLVVGVAANRNPAVVAFDAWSVIAVVADVRIFGVVLRRGIRKIESLGGRLALGARDVDALDAERMLEIRALGVDELLIAVRTVECVVALNTFKADEVVLASGVRNGTDCRLITLGTLAVKTSLTLELVLGDCQILRTNSEKVAALALNPE